MPRKQKKEGAGLFSSIGRVASRFASPAGRLGSTVSRGATAATSAASRGAIAATSAASRGATAASRGATLAGEAGEVVARPSLASRLMSGVNSVSAIGTLGLLGYQVSDIINQKRRDEAADRRQAAQDAMYAQEAADVKAEAAKQKLEDDARQAKYDTDYANDRKKIEEDAKIARQNELDAIKIEAERQRKQDIADAKAYADLLEAQQMAADIQRQQEDERAARMAAVIQAAISAGLRGTTPSVPANIPVTTKPTTTKPTTTKPTTRGYGKRGGAYDFLDLFKPPPPKRPNPLDLYKKEPIRAVTYGRGKKQHKRTIKDLGMELASLGLAL